MQQAIDATQVDKGAILGNIFDHALDHLTFLEVRQGFLFGFLALFFQEQPSRQHNVAAATIEFDDFHREALADKLIKVTDGAQINLRPRQERLEANVDHQPTFNAADNFPIDDTIVVMHVADLIPDLDLVSLLFGEDHQPVAILLTLEEDIDLIADLQVSRLPP